MGTKYYYLDELARNSDILTLLRVQRMNIESNNKLFSPNTNIRCPVRTMAKETIPKVCAFKLLVR